MLCLSGFSARQSSRDWRSQKASRSLFATLSCRRSTDWLTPIPCFVSATFGRRIPSIKGKALKILVFLRTGDELLAAVEEKFPDPGRKQGFGRAETGFAGLGPPPGSPRKST
jgi:hypothetical protein